MTPPGGVGQRRLVRSLSDAGVDFILIGGLAVSAHGYERATRDVDIVYSTDRVSCGRLASALTDLGAEIQFADHPSSGSADADFVRSLQEGGHFRFSTDAGPLDAISWSLGRDFESMRADAAETVVGETTVLICSYEDLVRMKSAAGRPQDLADLEALERLRSEGPNEEDANGEPRDEAEPG